MRRVDVVALTVGLVVTGVAVGCLWLACGGTVDWAVLGVAAPVALVAVGVLGLALSRRT